MPTALAPHKQTPHHMVAYRTHTGTLATPRGREEKEKETHKGKDERQSYYMGQNDILSICPVNELKPANKSVQD